MRIFLFILVLCSLITPIFAATGPDSVSTALFEKAVKLFYAGKYAAASAGLGGVRDRDSTLVAAYDFQGLIMNELGLPLQANQFFRQGLRFDSANLLLLRHAAQGALLSSSFHYSEVHYSISI